MCYHLYDKLWLWNDKLDQVGYFSNDILQVKLIPSCIWGYPSQIPHFYCIESLLQQQFRSWFCIFELNMIHETQLSLMIMLVTIVTRTEPEPVKPAGPTGFEPPPVRTAPDRFRTEPFFLPEPAGSVPVPWRWPAAAKGRGKLDFFLNLRLGP